MTDVFRAFVAGDTPLTAWARDAEGRRDMTGETVAVGVYSDGCLLKTLDATSPQAGQIDFTVAATDAQQWAGCGPLALMMLADGEVARIGLLEIV